MVFLLPLAVANTWDDPTLALVLPEGTALPLDGRATVMRGPLGPDVEVVNTSPARSSLASNAEDLLRARSWQAGAGSRPDPRAVRFQQGRHHIGLRSLASDEDATLWITVGVPIPEGWGFLGLDPTKVGVYLAEPNRIVLWGTDPTALGVMIEHLLDTGWTTGASNGGSFTLHKAGAELSIVAGSSDFIVTREGVAAGETQPPSFTFRLRLPGGGTLDASSPTLEWRERELCVTGDQSAWGAELASAGWQTDGAGPLLRRDDRQARIDTHGGRTCVAFEARLGSPWASFARAADRAFVTDASASQLAMEISANEAKKMWSEVDAALRADGWRASGDWAVLSSGERVTFLSRSWTKGGSTLQGQRVVEPDRESLVLRLES